MKAPYNIKTGKRIYKGKTQVYYLLTINPESGVSEETCKNWQRKTIRAKNKTEAKRKAVEIVDRLRQETFERSDSSPFGLYTKSYMIDGKCHYQKYARTQGRELAKSYMTEYRRLYEAHITTDIICKKPMKQITRSDLLRFSERIIAKLGVSSTARKVFKILKQNMNYAYIMGDIPYNPAAGMRDIQDKKKERGILTIEEVGTLFPVDGYGPWKGRQEYLAFLLAYSAGMRKGEVLGLKWSKVNFEKRAVHIDEAYHSIGGEMGKTKKGVKRWTPLPDKTLEALVNWKKDTRFSGDDNFVFCYQRRFRDISAGRNYSATWWQKNFKSAMEAAGIDHKSRNIVPHSLRHSLNTHLQDMGYSRDKIRETLGWSAPAVQDIYTHGDMMDHSGQANLIDSLLNTTKK